MFILQNTFTLGDLILHVNENYIPYLLLPSAPLFSITQQPKYACSITATLALRMKPILYETRVKIHQQIPFTSARVFLSVSFLD